MADRSADSMQVRFVTLSKFRPLYRKPTRVPNGALVSRLACPCVGELLLPFSDPRVVLQSCQPIVRIPLAARGGLGGRCAQTDHSPFCKFECGQSRHFARYAIPKPSGMRHSSLNQVRMEKFDQRCCLTPPCDLEVLAIAYEISAVPGPCRGLILSCIHFSLAQKTSKPLDAMEKVL